MIALDHTCPLSDGVIFVFYADFDEATFRLVCSLCLVELKVLVDWDGLEDVSHKNP